MLFSQFRKLYLPVVLIITSIGTFALAITRITQYVVDGEFQNIFSSYRTDKK